MTAKDNGTNTHTLLEEILDKVQAIDESVEEIRDRLLDYFELKAYAPNWYNEAYGEDHDHY